MKSTFGQQMRARMPLLLGGRQWLLAGLLAACTIPGQRLASAEPATAGPAMQETSSAQQRACDRAGFRVVIDVGHTREHYGAISAHGITEYDFNLKLGRVIAQSLKDAGFAKATLLVTEGPAKKSLFDRVRRAAGLNAQLFLSIHHDSVPDPLMSKWQEDGRVLPFCDRFTGHSIFISNDNPDRAGSLLFGRLLGLRMKAHGLTYTPHYIEKFMGSRQRIRVDAEAGVYRYDQLIVLRATRMPAVLLEAGMIVNRTDAATLAGPERQATIAGAAVEAVDAFCAQRAGHRPQLVARAPHVERQLKRAEKRAQQSAKRTTRTAAKKQGPDSKKR
jgi:N-acetylmuramoyl-L-alanine amidase